MSERKKYRWRVYPWQVGDRCKVTEIDGTSEKGTVAGIGEDVSKLIVKCDDGHLRVAHLAECTPLKKKEKPKPREWWINIAHNGAMYIHDTESAAISGGRTYKSDCIHPSHKETVHVREIRPMREQKERAK